MMRIAIAGMLVAVLTGVGRCRGAIVLTSIAPAYDEDFDTLSNTDPSSAVPTGWYFSELNGGADSFYAPDSGLATGGDTYSYGEGFSTERAFGTLLSGALTLVRSTIGAEFINGGTSEIVAISIAYRGEQWRLGSVIDDLDSHDKLEFGYSTDAATFTDASASWVAHTALDFISPLDSGTTGAKNGNNNFTNVSSTITGLSIAPGGKFWIRWFDFNAPATDDGLAVDDFTITASYAAVPEPGAILFGAVVCFAIGIGVCVRSAALRRAGRAADRLRR